MLQTLQGLPGAPAHHVRPVRLTTAPTPSRAVPAGLHDAHGARGRAGHARRARAPARQAKRGRCGLLPADGSAVGGGESGEHGESKGKGTVVQNPVFTADVAAGGDILTAGRSVGAANPTYAAAAEAEVYGGFDTTAAPDARPADAPAAEVVAAAPTSAEPAPPSLAAARLESFSGFAAGDGDFSDAEEI